MKNPLVVLYSIIALFFIYLMFVVDWLFIMPAAFLSWLSQEELMKNKKKK